MPHLRSSKLWTCPCCTFEQPTCGKCSVCGFKRGTSLKNHANTSLQRMRRMGGKKRRRKAKKAKRESKAATRSARATEIKPTRSANHRSGLKKKARTQPRRAARNAKEEVEADKKEQSAAEEILGDGSDDADIEEDEEEDCRDIMLKHMICRVCRSDSDQPGNDLIFCDRCFSCYHQKCHPKLKKVPDGFWLCALCSPSKYEPRVESSSKRKLEQQSSLRRSARKPFASAKWEWDEPCIEPWRQATEVSEEVTDLYKVIQKSTGLLGGNATGGAIYGEMTRNSFQRVVDAMVEKTGLCTSSSFLDIGAGLGKPNMHVAVEPGVDVSVGMELMEVRWQLSLYNLNATLNADTFLKKRKPNVAFTKRDICSVKCLDPFTHIYMYDIAFTPQVLESISKAFNSSTTPMYLVSYHKPRTIIWEYGFLVNLVSYVPNTSMMGSGQKRTAWIYKRTVGVPPTSEGEGKIDHHIAKTMSVLRRSSHSSYKVWLKRKLDQSMYAARNPRSSIATPNGKPFYRGCLIPW